MGWRTALDTEEETARLATFLINLPPQDMQRRTFDALGVYVGRHALPTWDRESARRDVARTHPPHGWQAVAAVEVEASGGSAPSSDELSDAPMLGVAYGYCGAPIMVQQQVVAGFGAQWLPRPESPS